MSETKSPLGGLTRRGFLKTTGAVTAVAPSRHGRCAGADAGECGGKFIRRWRADVQERMPRQLR
ncbi:MAG: twin-arginine translocation signal domain-containing protein [Eggerthella lenta]